MTTWRDNSSHCPLCSVVIPTSNTFELKGFYDMPFVGRTTEATDRSTSAVTVIDVSDNSSSEEFEDLPPFSS